MNLRNFLLSSAIALLFSSFGCKKKSDNKEEELPTACYNASNRLIKVGDIVNFTNCSENYDRVEWDFGDGESSTIASPSHQFKNKGTFQTTLTTYKGSKSAKVTNPIVCGYQANGYAYFVFSKWDLPTGYKSYSAASLHRSTDMNSRLPFYFGTRRSNDTLILYGDFNLPDMSTSYRFKVYSIAHPEASSPTTPMLIDSFYTDVIDVFNGPKTPFETHKTNLATVETNISKISFE